MIIPVRYFLAAASFGAAMSATMARAELVIGPAEGPPPESIGFGDHVMKLGRSVERIVIRNTGPETVRDLSVSILQGPGAGYELMSLSANSIPAGGSVEAVVGFMPQSAGEHAGVFRIRAGSPQVQEASVPLSGKGYDKFSVSGSNQFYGGPSNSATAFIITGTNASGQLVATCSTGSNFSGYNNQTVVGTFDDTRHYFKVTVVRGDSPFFIFSATLTRTDAYAIPLDDGDLSGPGMILVQPDGRLIVTAASGADAMTRRSIVRLLPDGTVDGSFAASFDETPTGGFIQWDGRTVFCGPFTKVNGRPRAGLVRLDHDGSVDEAFAPPVTGSPGKVLALPDGKMMVLGEAASTGSITRAGILRLNADGSLDGTFDAGLGSGALPSKVAAAVQPDGKVIVGGPIHLTGEDEPRRIVRFNADGTRDTGFQEMVVGDLHAIAVRKDGKILVSDGGSSSWCNIRLLDAAGIPDFGFHISAGTAGPVSSMILQEDGKVCIGGSFGIAGNFYRRASMARFNADGTTDQSFDPFGSSTGITSLAPGAGGGMFASGDLWAIAGSGHSTIAKIPGDSSTSVFEVAGPDSLVWTRSGGAAELSSVIFESSTDGGATWLKLGDGTRTATGWELQGVPVPNVAYLRATGRAAISSSGDALMREHKLVGRAMTALENWRNLKFGSPFNEGIARDGHDADRDGLPNLVEYAFGQEPGNPGSRTLPAWVPEGSTWRTSFTPPAGVEGLTYGAEWSGTMAAGDWHPATDATAGGMRAFSVPAAGEPRLFFRMKVGSP